MSDEIKATWNLDKQITVAKFSPEKELELRLEGYARAIEMLKAIPCAYGDADSGLCECYGCQQRGGANYLEESNPWKK